MQRDRQALPLMHAKRLPGLASNACKETARPTRQAGIACKETYYRMQRDLLSHAKRPTIARKETYYRMQRDLLSHAKRPALFACISRPGGTCLPSCQHVGAMVQVEVGAITVVLKLLVHAALSYHRCPCHSHAVI